MKEQKRLFNVRNKRNKNWSWFDNEYIEIFGETLGGLSTAVYISLCRYADNNDGKCFPSQETLAKEVKISDRKVRSIIRDLEKYGVIKTTKERTSKGRWLNNVYWLLDKSNWIHPEARGADGQHPSERGSYGQPSEQNDIPIGTKRHTHRNVVPLNKTYKNKTYNNKTHNIAKQSFASNPINNIINLFENINPSYERLYSNKTQRGALSRLIDKYGTNVVSKIIGHLPKTNSMKYAPVITTPIELENKMGRLILFMKKHQEEKLKNNILKL